jgi:hypothetical protein
VSDQAPPKTPGVIQTCIGPLAVYWGRCCREWIMLVGQGGRCGLCGEQPRYEREFEG